MFDLDAFLARGIAELPGAFSPEQARAMGALIWDYLEGRSSIRCSEPATWPPGGIPPGLSLKALKGRDAFRPLTANGRLREALDAIFGTEGWTAPRRGARILLTFPGPGPWRMPTGWHFDAGFDVPTFPVPWIQLWACVDEVVPCGGGTLLLDGSHRLVERYRQNLPESHRPGNFANFGRFLRQHPFLDQLRQGGTDTDSRRDLLGRQEDIDGLPVRPIEFTGRPGDMYISHGQVLHCASPNTSANVRLMLTGAIYPC